MKIYSLIFALGLLIPTGLLAQDAVLDEMTHEEVVEKAKSNTNFLRGLKDKKETKNDWFIEACCVAVEDAQVTEEFKQQFQIISSSKLSNLHSLKIKEFETDADAFMKYIKDNERSLWALAASYIGLTQKDEFKDKGARGLLINNILQDDTIPDMLKAYLIKSYFESLANPMPSMRRKNQVAFLTNSLKRMWRNTDVQKMAMLLYVKGELENGSRKIRKEAHWLFDEMDKSNKVQKFRESIVEDLKKKMSPEKYDEIK